MQKKLLLLSIFIILISLTGCGHTHSWVEASCTKPKTCSECGQTEGEPTDHSVLNWEIKTEATCTQTGIEEGICTNCRQNIQREISKTEHTLGEWSVTTAPTLTSAGVKSQSCTVCGIVLNIENFTLTEEEQEALFKSSCKEYNYETIARDPDAYNSTYGKYIGEIIQVLENGNDIQMRVNITKGRYGYSDTIYVFYTKKDGESRLLEDDIITIYGINAGTISYESIFGATITLPCVYAKYIELN